MKKTLRFITTLLLSIMFLIPSLCSYHQAQAYTLADYGLSPSDCGTSYVNYVKDSGLAVYASKGVTATSGKRFKTIGVTVVCKNTGESKSFRVDDGIFSKDSEENSDGNTYTACIVNMQKAFDSGYFPKAKARYDSNRAIQFSMNSIMITTYDGYNEGWIDSDGNRSYGTVYYDASSIYNVSPGGGWGTLAYFETYFNKSFTAWNGKQALPDTTPYVRGMNLLKG